MERQKKLRHLREADIVGVVSASVDTDTLRSNNNNCLLSSPSTSARASSVMPEPQPQPLPLPELSMLLKRDGYAVASKRVVSSTESGRFKDLNIGG